MTTVDSDEDLLAIFSLIAENVPQTLRICEKVYQSLLDAASGTFDYLL